MCDILYISLHYGHRIMTCAFVHTKACNSKNVLNNYDVASIRQDYEYYNIIVVY